MLISKKYLTPELVHVFEVHEFEGVLVGAAAAHHGVDLGSTLLGSGQREYHPPSYWSRCDEDNPLYHCIGPTVALNHPRQLKTREDKIIVKDVVQYCQCCKRRNFVKRVLT